MDHLPHAFGRAVAEGRFREAAADRDLVRRATQETDAVARALIALCEAHASVSEGDMEGARLQSGRAVRWLEQAPLDPFAGVLIGHAHQLLGALLEGRAPPPLPVGFR